MDDARLIRTSKFLSKHLRHAPERIGLSLEPGGWVVVDALLAACARAGLPLSRAELDEVVERNNKRRFAYDTTGERGEAPASRSERGKRVRANQGHSVAVDLQLAPQSPPDVLYHGTRAQRSPREPFRAGGEGAVGAIRREGLRKMRRHHVHLSPDVQTATIVGRRHGRPVVFAVDAAAMARDGFTFYRSENGVWLVDAVPPQYLRVARA